jgi:flagellar biosynthesis/type III secretory pathway M-ring protein FliF/YscJ
MLLIGVLTLNALRAPVATPAAALASGGATPAGALPATASAATASRATVAAPRPPAPRIEFPEADTQVRDRVVQTVDKDPDAAARLVKSWIKEG